MCHNALVQLIALAAGVVQVEAAVQVVQLGTARQVEGGDIRDCVRAQLLDVQIVPSQAATPTGEGIMGESERRICHKEWLHRKGRVSPSTTVIIYPHVHLDCERYQYDAPSKRRITLQQFGTTLSCRANRGSLSQV
jgi:hypothetical protein